MSGPGPKAITELNKQERSTLRSQRTRLPVPPTNHSIHGSQRHVFLQLLPCSGDPSRNSPPAPRCFPPPRLLQRRFWNSPKFLGFSLCIYIVLLISFLLLQCEFLISLILTLLGYVPGIIYAIYVIVTVDPDSERRRHRDGDYYVVVSWSGWFKDSFSVWIEYHSMISIIQYFLLYHIHVLFLQSYLPTIRDFFLLLLLQMLNKCCFWCSWWVRDWTTKQPSNPSESLSVI